MNKLIKQTDYKVTVDLLEKTDKIGGRLAIRKIGDKYYETGGTIIHERNEYAKDLVNDLGMHLMRLKLFLLFNFRSFKKRIW